MSGERESLKSCKYIRCKNSFDDQLISNLVYGNMTEWQTEFKIYQAVWHGLCGSIYCFQHFASFPIQEDCQVPTQSILLSFLIKQEVRQLYLQQGVVDQGKNRPLLWSAEFEGIDLWVAV